MLKFETTSMKDYAGGSAKIKALIVGGTSTGKTTFAANWPQPVFADVESGLASVVDKGVVRAKVRSSRDMLEFLEVVKTECAKPAAKRPFHTVVIDTIDAFQRMVKDEWMRDNRAATFTGREAWGYLDSKMGMLTARLLNVDANVVVLVHSQDRKGEEDTVIHGLQLQGSIANTLVNDFDLVGRLDTIWKPGQEGPTLAYGLTFKRTPDHPYLKDRLGLLADQWLTLEDGPSDFSRLFDRLNDRMKELEERGVAAASTAIAVDEVSLVPAGVVSDAEGAPLPEVAGRPAPLHTFKKGELVALAQAAGLTLAGNTLKAEFVAALEEHRKANPDRWNPNGTLKPAPAVETQQSEAEQSSEAKGLAGPGELARAVDDPVALETPAEPEKAPDPAPEPVVAEAAPEPEPEPEAKDEPEVAADPDTVTNERSGTVAEATEVEAPEPEAEAAVTHDEAVETVKEVLDAEVLSDVGPDDCAKPGCTPELEGSNPMYQKISSLRFKRRLCDGCYQTARSNGKPPEGCGWAGDNLTGPNG